MSGGRPRWEPTKGERAAVKTMVANGIGHVEIAQVLGIARETLEKRCGYELMIGATEAIDRVASSLFKMATTGKTSPVKLQAAQFWLKCRGRWRESEPIMAAIPFALWSDERAAAQQAAEDAYAQRPGPRLIYDRNDWR